MSGVAQLTASAVRAIHAEVLAALGGTPGVRAPHLLEAAVAAPQATAGGTPIAGDPVDTAAATLFFLCRQKPFFEGNEGTGLAACLVLLDANGCLPDPDLAGRAPDAWASLVHDVAAFRIDHEQTTARLRQLLSGASPDGHR